MHIIFTFNFSWFLFLNKILFTVDVSQIFGTDYYTNTVFFVCRFVWLNSPKVCNKLNTCESYISDSRCRVPVMPFFDPTSTSLVWLRRIQFITCTIYSLSVMTNDASSLLCSIAMTFYYHMWPICGEWNSKPSFDTVRKVSMTDSIRNEHSTCESCAIYKINAVLSNSYRVLHMNVSNSTMKYYSLNRHHLHVNYLSLIHFWKTNLLNFCTFQNSSMNKNYSVKTHLGIFTQMIKLIYHLKLKLVQLKLWLNNILLNYESFTRFVKWRSCHFISNNSLVLIFTRCKKHNI